MGTRILIFGHHETTRNLYALFLRFKGYEVLDYASITTCPVVDGATCPYPCGESCADIILFDIDIQGEASTAAICRQLESGCRIPPGNKLVLSAGLKPLLQGVIAALGCKSLLKPFKLQQLLLWVEGCERRSRSCEQYYAVGGGGAAD